MKVQVVYYLYYIVAFDSHSTDDNSFFSADFNDHAITIPKHQQQTNLCFSLHIDQGKVAMFPPAKVSIFK